MELKCLCGVKNNVLSSFLSYLYGIEIENKADQNRMNGGFNRTFMELKYV